MLAQARTAIKKRVTNPRDVVVRIRKGTSGGAACRLHEKVLFMNIVIFLKLQLLHLYLKLRKILYGCRQEIQKS
jgi:hypothetical protein